MENLDEQNYSCLTMEKLIAFLFYAILNPFLIVWNIIGTVMIVEVQNENIPESVELY